MRAQTGAGRNKVPLRGQSRRENGCRNIEIGNHRCRTALFEVPFSGIPVYTMTHDDVILVTDDKPIAVAVSDIYC